MVSGEYIAISSLGLAMIGLVYKIYRDDGTKRKRIYERLDEVKKATEEKFVSKEVCGIHTEQIKSDVSEIKMDVKSLLRKNGI